MRAQKAMITQMISTVVLLLVLAFALAVSPAAAASRPPMAHERLTYWPERVASTRKWSRFMYGTAKFEPKLIVEHWTGSQTQDAAVDYWNESSKANWAQFIIDPQGRITQLAPLDIVAKQAYGVSPWAIGIEHVGESSSEILSRPRERRASYRLTCWLREHFDLSLSDVIGHAEVPSNQLFHFTYRGWQWIEESGYVFHDDFPHKDMIRYRKHLQRICG
ncbi:MAG: N-acetylmuramoyl-L-alanine amidase [Solirubrobacterales bacterium]